MFSNSGAKRDLLQQLPDAVELLSSVLSSGVGYREGVMWVATRCSGQVQVELQQIIEAMNVGDSISQSLLQYESDQKDPSLRELALKLALADQLGTSVSNQLISLATALRAEYLVEFRKTGSTKETQLLMPLVFLVLPVTVLFALYPSVQFLRFGSI